MPDTLSNASAPRRHGEDRYGQLRKLAGRAWQLRASVRGAEHFLVQQTAVDHDTGIWLIACARAQAEELASDIDNFARGLKDGAPEPALAAPLPKLRARAHQLHAATRAADHFLEQESRDDHDTGNWLIATALGLADRLATELDDLASSLKHSANDSVIDADHAAITRRAALSTAV